MLARILSILHATLFLGQVAPPSEVDWRWLDEHRGAALEAFMPTRQGARAIVTYRSYRDLYHDAEERYFSIGFAPGASFNRDRLEATVVVPTGGSVQQQILDLHMRDRLGSLEALLPRITVRRLLLNADRCTAIRVRMDALSKTAISLPERDTVFLHPFVHHFSIALAGAKVDATLYDDENPLVLWARDTLSALLACGSGK